MKSFPTFFYQVFFSREKWKGESSALRLFTCFLNSLQIRFAYSSMCTVWCFSQATPINISSWKKKERKNPWKVLPATFHHFPPLGVFILHSLFFMSFNVSPCIQLRSKLSHRLNTIKEYTKRCLPLLSCWMVWWWIDDDVHALRSSSHKLKIYKEEISCISDDL